MHAERIASVYPHSFGARLAAAVFTTLYAMVEASITNSHRDYPNAFCTWALVPTPSVYSEAFALGVCIWFIGSSGYAKVVIGCSSAERKEFKQLHGRAGYGWLEPMTLKSVLEWYGGMDIGEGGPASPALNKWLRGNDYALTFLTVSTLVFEVLMVPLCLFVPAKYRYVMTAGSVLLHVGIAAAQSCGIGVAFLSCIATYTLGFGSTRVEMFTSEWWVAGGVGVLVPAAMLVLRKQSVLPEDWPSSPIALFPWSSVQWKKLFDRFELKTTRLVFTTAKVTDGNQLVGKVVRPVKTQEKTLGSSASWICTKALAG